MQLLVLCKIGWERSHLSKIYIFVILLCNLPRDWERYVNGEDDIIKVKYEILE